MAEDEQSGDGTGLTRSGKVSYMQIPATNTAESTAFYEKVFGWTLRGGGADHFSFSDASGEMVGAWVTGRAISQDPGVLPYIYVAAIDDAIDSITSNGGVVVRDVYSEGGGDLWVATFRDPAGNVIGIWQMGGPRRANG